MSKFLFLFLNICFLFAFSPGAIAQKGTKINLWGGPQLVSLINFNDYISLYDPSSKLNRLPTYRAGGGIDLIHNFASTYGVQSGVYYSQQGQHYDGYVKKNNSDSAINFKSHIYLNYLRIPLMFRFSSELDPQDRLNLSIFGGIQLGILQNVQEVFTDPAPHDSFLRRYPDFDFSQLYKKTDLGIAAGAQFNIRITDRIGTMIGARWDRSFGTIENLDYKLPKDAPEEWQYPVSTKKGVGGTDNSTRKPTRLSSVNIFTGISISLGKPSEEDRRIPVDEE